MIIPFIIVFPGIIAFQLYGSSIADGDQAYPMLIRDLLPAGLRGLFFAALFGAVMSSLDSMLNSASTLFTMDIYQRHIRPGADADRIVRVGRLSTGVFVVVGCLLAPFPGQFEGVYAYMQLVWGFISPAITAVFVFGLLVPRAPLSAAVSGLLVGPVIYGILNWQLPEVAFLNHMAFTFLTIIAVMTGFTLLRPRTEPVVYATASDIDLTPSRGARWATKAWAWWNRSARP